MLEAVKVGSSEPVHIEDVTVEQVWSQLSTNANAVLIDVRTKAEWAFVGVPDLAEIGKQTVLFEWQTYPDGAIDPEFADALSKQLEAANVGTTDELFFICRSGGRSLKAAEAMAAKGYTACRNVADGFEGPLDKDRHRGQLGGWKHAGLPWTQN